MEQLANWKGKSSRLPLIIKGARQVGKTSLVNDFGTTFRSFHAFNFQKNPQLKEGFRENSDPQKILKFLEIISEASIDISNDLIFFDEVQECPEALNSLKFFAEEHPQAYIIAAGSLLGVYLSAHSFPVGKVQFEYLYPFSFSEFLQACGKKKLAAQLDRLDKSSHHFHEELIGLLRIYFTIGGMPKAIATYVETNDVKKVRAIQEDLLTSYRADFAKYSGPISALKILTIFENIPKQLAKDNRKFQFNSLKKEARYSEFSSSVDWLVGAGLAYKIPILNHAEIPLKAYAEENKFKLYFFDIGLLAALTDLPTQAFFQESDLFKTFKGAFVENYVLQEFVCQRTEELYSWHNQTAEVDFLYSTNDMQLMPIEVKSGESGKLKSLQVFFQKYKCQWKTRCSMHKLEIRQDSGLRTIPLYMASKI